MIGEGRIDGCSLSHTAQTQCLLCALSSNKLICLSTAAMLRALIPLCGGALNLAAEGLEDGGELCVLYWYLTEAAVVARTIWQLFSN